MARIERCQNHKSLDGQHCNCWWDGDVCHWCGARAMTEAEKIEQGMVEGPPRRPQ